MRQTVPMLQLALGLFACCAAPLQAGTGALIADYQAALATIPTAQGWELQAQCLRIPCPYVPEDGAAACFWQGRQDRNGDSQWDNNCQFSIGCHLPDETQLYNSPPEVLSGQPASCSNTEWLVFDDGNNLDGRLIIPDSTVPSSPPYGASGFYRTPLDHLPLRISTGDGNGIALSLPWTEGNDRNSGKIRFRKSITWPASNAITVLAKIAAGPLKKDQEILEIRTPAYRFGFTVNGDPASTDLGRVGYRGWLSFGGYLFGNNRVVVAQPSPTGAVDGEFFMLRAVCRGDGTFTAYLNESLDSATQGSVPTVVSTPEIAFGVARLEDGCFWVDSIQFIEGAIPPPDCPDPVFDINHDSRVDARDLSGSPYSFESCATGPGIAPSQFQALPNTCQCLDVNEDKAIDSVDFAAFQRCLSLDGPIDPTCDDRTDLR